MGGGVTIAHSQVLVLSNYDGAEIFDADIVDAIFRMVGFL